MQVTQFLLWIQKHCWSMYTMLCMYMLWCICDVIQCCSCVLLICVSPSAHFFVPFSVWTQKEYSSFCSILKNNKYGSGNKELSLFFLNSMLLILSVNVFSFGDIPRCGVSNSLWYPLFLKENPPLTTQLLIKTLSSCEE